MSWLTNGTMINYSGNPIGPTTLRSLVITDCLKGSDLNVQNWVTRIGFELYQINRWPRAYTDKRYTPNIFQIKAWSLCRHDRAPLVLRLRTDEWWVPSNDWNVLVCRQYERPYYLTHPDEELYEVITDLTQIRKSPFGVCNKCGAKSMLNGVCYVEIR
jgi:hypothetical protein